MNHWLDEELAWLVCVERQRELENHRLPNLFSVVRGNWAITARFALKLSDWLIATGENLRLRYENTSHASPWVSNRRFVR